MYKAYKFRLYPNDNQKKLINKTYGCTRFIYNHFLNKCKEEKFIKAYDMCKELKELESVTINSNKNFNFYSFVLMLKFVIIC